ncbi:MAG: hypothetical protein HZA49_02475 [Planctomycetes bacterium]|nr:hypothetical protein [Planctomycetota bacterium]
MDLYLVQRQFNDAKAYFQNMDLYQTRNGKICVKVALQPSYQIYVISILFPDSYPYEMPSVNIDKPDVLSGPHRYNTGNICYLHPSMWNPGQHNLSFVIQRTAKWINKYEVWKNSGVWPGRSIAH